MTPVTSSTRDRLNELKRRKAEARERITKAKQGLASANGDDQARQAFLLAQGQAESDLAIASELETTLLRQLSGVSQDDGFGDSFLDDPATHQTLYSLAHSKQPIGHMNLGTASSRDQLLATIQSGSWGQQPQAAVGPVELPEGDPSRLGPWYGIVPSLRRRLRLLDLIGSQPMEGSAFHYSQESGDLTLARETAEGELKPEGELVLTDAEVKAATVAIWLKVTRQALADVPQLTTTINQRLTYSALRRLEDEILAGDGVGEDILGILNTSGIGNTAFSAGEALSDLALDAITAVMASNAEPMVWS